MKITKAHLRRIINEELASVKEAADEAMSIPTERLASVGKDLHAARNQLEEGSGVHELVTKALYLLQNEVAKAQGVYRSVGDPSVGGQGGD